MIPAWTANYVGKSYAELNCFDLLCRVYRDVFHVELFDMHQETERIRTGHWQQVTGHYRRGDVLLFRSTDFERHVGMNLDGTHMLHADTSNGVIVERWRSPIWQHRLTGVYRCSQLN